MQDHPVRTLGDLAALGVTVGTILEILPYLAALLSIIWTVMRITEMMTGKPFSQFVWVTKLRNLFR